MELEAVRAAEEGRLEEAMQLLNEAVTKAPDHASTYNNRAQVFDLTQRLLIDTLGEQEFIVQVVSQN